MLRSADVLVVEDEYLIAIELQRILEAAGAASVVIVRSVSEGTSHALGQRFGLALVSLGPEFDLAAANLIRALRAEGLAVVAISSDASHRDGIPGLPGVVCILKPFTEDDVLAAVRAVGLGL